MCSVEQYNWIPGGREYTTTNGNKGLRTLLRSGWSLLQLPLCRCMSSISSVKTPIWDNEDEKIRTQWMQWAISLLLQRGKSLTYCSKPSIDPLFSFFRPFLSFMVGHIPPYSSQSISSRPIQPLSACLMFQLPYLQLQFSPSPGTN